MLPQPKLKKRLTPVAPTTAGEIDANDCGFQPGAETGDEFELFSSWLTYGAHSPALYRVARLHLLATAQDSRSSAVDAYIPQLQLTRKRLRWDDRAHSRGEAKLAESRGRSSVLRNNAAAREHLAISQAIAAERAARILAVVSAKERALQPLDREERREAAGLTQTFVRGALAAEQRLTLSVEAGDRPTEEELSDDLAVTATVLEQIKAEIRAKAPR